MFSGKQFLTSRSKESWIPGKRGVGQGVSLGRRRLEIVGQGEGEASKLKPRKVSCGAKEEQKCAQRPMGAVRKVGMAEGTLKTKCAPYSCACHQP